MSEALKVIDRRGQDKSIAPRIGPDEITAVRRIAPMTYVAEFPGNRCKEVEFKVSPTEARGFRLLGTNAKGVGADGRKAIHAARMRILSVIKTAMKRHAEHDAPKADRYV